MKKAIIFMAVMSFGFLASANSNTNCAHSQIAASTPFTSSVAKVTTTKANTAQETKSETGSGTR